MKYHDICYNNIVKYHSSYVVCTVTAFILINFEYMFKWMLRYKILYTISRADIISKQNLITNLKHFWTKLSDHNFESSFVVCVFYPYNLKI